MRLSEATEHVALDADHVVGDDGGGDDGDDHCLFTPLLQSLYHMNRAMGDNNKSFFGMSVAIQIACQTRRVNQFVPIRDRGVFQL